MALWLPHTYHVSRIRIMDLRRCAAARGGAGPGASSTDHVSAPRIRLLHRKALPGGRCNGPRGGCLTYHVSRLRITYLASRAPDRAPPPLTYHAYALRITYFSSFVVQGNVTKHKLYKDNGSEVPRETPSPPTVKQFPRGLTGPTHSRLQRRAGLAPTPRPFASATGEERRGGRAGEARSHIPSHTQRWLARR